MRWNATTRRGVVSPVWQASSCHWLGLSARKHLPKSCSEKIKNPTFAVQTVGRILRMPLGMHFPQPELNLGYLYTNYKRNEVITGYAKSAEQNRPAIYSSYRKQSVEPLMIESVFMSRTDYNDLGDSFQSTFKKVADSYFALKGKESASIVRRKSLRQGRGHRTSSSPMDSSLMLRLMTMITSRKSFCRKAAITNRKCHSMTLNTSTILSALTALQNRPMRTKSLRQNAHGGN